MSDNDLIRRGDAKRIFGGSVFGQAIARCLDDVPAALPAQAPRVKPLEWKAIGSSFTAEDPIFKVVAVASDPDAYEAERASCILGSLVAAPVPDVTALVEAGKELIEEVGFFLAAFDVGKPYRADRMRDAWRAALSAWNAALGID